MIGYSPRAARALAFLKRSYNDVDIFVEDTGNHNMWLLIARKLLPEDVHISSVNMLGGRNSVLEACRLDQVNTGRKKLYIIDGDFDFLLGKSKPRLKYLCRIKAYCIENLLIKEGPIVSAALESNPLLNETQIATTFDFDDLEREVDQQLKSLFVLYATTLKTAPHIKTVAHPVNTLFTSHSDGPRLAPAKVAERMRELLSAIEAHAGVQSVSNEHSSVSARAQHLPIEQIVSGKDYVLPLALTRFRARCGYRGNAENFKVALARTFDRQADPNLTKRLRNISA